MGDVVNLRLHRKRQARAARDAEAVGNRARFGQPKAARDVAVQEEERAARHLEGHRRDNRSPAEGEAE